MARVVKMARTPLTYVAHTLALAITVLVLVWSFHFRGGLAWDSTNKLLISNLHPVLMLIGFIILGGEANMSYKSLPLSYNTKKRIHLVVHAISLAMGILGISAVFKFHNETGVANLYSLHSWFGIVVIVLYGLQWLYGFLILFYTGGPLVLQNNSTPGHVLAAMLIYVLAVATAALGFQEKLTFLQSSGVTKYGSEAILVNFTAVLTVLFGVFVILAVSPKPPPPV